MGLFEKAFYAFLDEKDIRVCSIDIADKIKERTLEQGYIFIFESSKEIREEIREKCLKNKSSHFKFYIKPLNLKAKFTLECLEDSTGIYTSSYKITSVEYMD